MIELNDYRIGNVLNYVGPLIDHRGMNGAIQEIDNLNDEESFILQIENTNRSIRAYSDDVRPIYLTPKFLIERGFGVDKGVIYTKDGITLLDIKYIEPGVSIFGQPEGLSYVDKGFGVVLENIVDMSNIKEVLSKVQFVNHVHSLQNYYELVLNRQFDV